jgi:DNA-binding SARP family transcriptional activator
MPRLALMLFGGFEARVAARALPSLPVKTHALLAYLGMRPGYRHPREKLAALLWGNANRARARDSLRHALAALRKAFGPAAASFLIDDGQMFTLDPEAVDVDVVTFERRLAETTPEAIDEAAALYRGDLLDGLALGEPAFDDWLRGERERLRGRAVEALAAALAHHDGAGARERAIDVARRLLELEPLREVTHRTLIRLYAACGRRDEALQHYERCVAMLQRELGVEPDHETTRLYQDALQQATKGSAALIGRGAEMEMLTTAAGGAARGRGGVAAITGEAGIGKTRLLRELMTTAARDGCTVLLGRCPVGERSLPFGGWIQAFRSAGVAADEEIVRGLDPVWTAELARLLPEASRPDLPRASEDPLRLFESVARLVDRLAARRPLVVALEDLHLADEMTPRLLAFLARRIGDTRVLIVCTARAEDVADHPVLRHVLDELARQPTFAPLALAALSETDTHALVRALARAGIDGDALARLGPRIWSASEGNPFVVAEMMRVANEGPAPGDPSGPALPDGVRRLVAARLERLGVRARELLDVAAVIEREFDFALLQRAAGLAEHEAAVGVEELVRRRVLHGVGGRFGFAHARVREVVYDGLPPARRAALRKAVGDAVGAGDGPPAS